MTLRELLAAHGLTAEDVLDAQVGRQSSRDVTINGRITAEQFGVPMLEIDIFARAKMEAVKQ